jgi:DNA phosphorothioation-associated DGQHR protein 1
MKKEESKDFQYIQAIKVSQPLGDFYAFSMDAETLNRLTYSLPAQVRSRIEAEASDAGGYSIFGSQRKQSKSRLDEIAKFIQTTDATFPNAIILAANYDDQGMLVEEASSRWDVIEEGKKGEERYRLKIPFGKRPVASIIDGQHRLHAFTRLENGDPHRDMKMLCVVYLDLPTPYHAFIFATINFNQKKVDRSLAYELFGFDVEDRNPMGWAPETLAVYLTRILNTENGSPLEGCITIAALPQEKIATASEEAAEEVTASEQTADEEAELSPPIRVSMATIVDGILRQISKNPKHDRYTIRKASNKEIGRGCLDELPELPLRRFYLNGNDQAIRQVISDYFWAVRDVIWKNAPPKSYLRKTIGVQALFDVLKVMLETRAITATTFSRRALTELLSPCSDLDPDGTKYQASGIGRREIKSVLLDALKLNVDKK